MELTQKFKLCTALHSASDVMNLVNWLENGFGYMAMTDYPYPANFLEPMPAWPIKVSCSRMLAETDLITGMYEAISVYYNYTGDAGSCYSMNSTATADLGTFAWDYQSCTEMVMPISSNGTSDMFPPSYFSLEALTEYCQQTWGVTPRPHWIPTYYGGRNIGAASNIVFSNGMLDPWRGGGVQQSISDSLVAILIKDGAHHLDLRAPNDADPQSVKDARSEEIQHIRQWIQQSIKNNKSIKRRS